MNKAAIEMRSDGKNESTKRSRGNQNGRGKVGAQQNNAQSIERMEARGQIWKNEGNSACSRGQKYFWAIRICRDVGMS